MSVLHRESTTPRTHPSERHRGPCRRIYAPDGWIAIRPSSGDPLTLIALTAVLVHVARAACYIQGAGDVP